MYGQHRPGSPSATLRRLLEQEAELDAKSSAPDRLGIFPEVLFETRRENISRAVPRERQLRLLRSYLVDWIVTVGLWVLFALIDHVDGFRRQFDVNDPTIQHTFATSERVPVWLLIVVAGIAPAVIIALFSSLVLRSFWDAHNGLLGLVLALALTTTITDIVKITVGRPRPDMLDRCQPAAGSVNASPPSYGLSNSSICTTDNLSRLKDGFRSFPSGHSSFSFAGLGFLALYTAGKLHMMDRKGSAVKAWISVAPLVAAALVAISRTMDYRHHWQDVTVGSILGYLVAWFTYRLYYPRLHSISSHRPYSPRIPASSSPENQISLPSHLHHHRAVSSSSDFDGSLDADHATAGRNGRDLEAGAGHKAAIQLQPTGSSHVPGTVSREGAA